METTRAIEQKGFDVRKKKKKGYKRQLVTDEIDCLIAVMVHKANLHDTKIGYWAAGSATFTYPICADGGYESRNIEEVETWKVLQKRWRFERTFA